MSFPGIFRRLFQKEGAGPLLRKEIIPPHADTHTADGGDPLDLAALGGVSAEELAALQQQVAKLAETVAGIKVDPWDSFPSRVPIAVDGVTFGGSDGRRAILPGETEARENWVKCDGGSDGKGGTVPDLRGRMILGASAVYAAGSTGGSATHAHVFSGTVGATTISTDQMPWHGHTNYNRVAYDGYGGIGAACSNGEPQGTTATGTTVIPTGGSAAHGHTLTGTVSAANALPPYYALAYIMRVA